MNLDKVKVRKVISGTEEESYLSPPLRKPIYKGFYPPLYSLSHHSIILSARTTSSPGTLYHVSPASPESALKTAAPRSHIQPPSCCGWWVDRWCPGRPVPGSEPQLTLSSPFRLQTLIIQRPPLCIQARPLPPHQLFQGVFCLPSPHSSTSCSMSQVCRFSPPLSPKRGQSWRQELVPPLTPCWSAGLQNDSD